MTVQLEYRSFAANLEVRNAGDGRTVFGIAVPWDQPQRISGALTEQWERGAFDHQFDAPYRVRFVRDHLGPDGANSGLRGVLVGAATRLANSDEGLYVEMRASRTKDGDETLELIKDRALPHLSIGFNDPRSRRLPGGVISRTRANLFEIASVMEGAFGDLAAVGGVRSRQGLPADLDTDEYRQARTMGMCLCVNPGCDHGRAITDADWVAGIVQGLPELPELPA